MDTKRKSSWILFMGTYPPRECGIATFTRYLSSAVHKSFSPTVKSKIAALNNDITTIYNYPEEVIYQIDENDVEGYLETARKINETDAIEVVNIQHEFGIFGGELGGNLIPFLEELKKPVVVTLHTVLPNPDKKMKRVMQSIAERSKCLVVMNNMAIDILKNDYGLVNSEIFLIPHGIPSVPFKTSADDKLDLGFKNNTILSSFGMLNPAKGYETVIKALPRVIEKYPNLRYIIVGETHPIIRKKEGESYRNSLEKLVKDLNLKKNVKFYNKYVRLSEIVKFLQATDIYISSSTNPNQIVSGTLSFAMGCGRAIVSTPFLHAREMVTADKGLLAEFNDPDSFAESIIKILSNPELKRSMEHSAYAYTRRMTWPNVALSYMDLFRRYSRMPVSDVLPRVKLNHLAELTGKDGIIQFAKNTKPDKQYGYSIDDNSRALIVCCMHYTRTADHTSVELAETYLNYIEKMFNNGRFYNFADMNMNPDFKNFSEEAHSRTMWALGYLTATPEMPDNLREKTRKLFTKGLTESMKLMSPRAVAYNIQGLYHYNRVYPSDINVDKIHKLADHLVSLFNDHKSDDWQWFEPYLTYVNARIPESLYLAYQLRKRTKYLDIAESTLNFLLSLTLNEGMFHPIGQNGWYIKHDKRAHFDQQPVEAATMVQTLMTAYENTNNKDYKNNAYTVFSWFLGNNYLRQTIYDEKSGGCHDGLGYYSINLNQGAEATISYLLARLRIE
ncbi:MAG: glycosyltransferase family 4 protein [Candidatus Altiarchaeota archaeon]